ncbi:hypothetical protein AURDEDRAFT_163379 [Auricularia subglabra TFB-10046 SS5]|nr:hypothetical protein AURDEDRAFT_163379 [Auricularia subglabra TFB-10046 SS5]
MPVASPLPALATQVAEASAQKDVSTVLGLADGIYEAADHVRANRRTAAALAGRIKSMADALVSALEPAESGTSPQLDVSTTAAFEAFQTSLVDAREELLAHGRQRYFFQLLHQKRDRDGLARVSEGAERAFDILMMQLRLHASSALSSKLDDIVARHREAIQRLTELSPEGPAIALPPKPQLHFGRDLELHAVVATLTRADSPGYVAILGGPGMGKTTLAVAALYHPAVELAYAERRYFIACDAAEGASNSFRLLAEAFGIVSSDPESIQWQMRSVFNKGRTLLVLDNFESAWEAADQRDDAERLIGFLGSIATVTLVVTMRGSERPQGVRWTQPFLPPLAALSARAAQQTFLSIADCPESDPALDPLLRHMDNVPLALVLLANLAQCETLAALSRRWQETETAMLIRGNSHTRVTSVDVSIRLSVRSPRMEAEPDALCLLSLLSLLPCGALDRDTGLWGIGNSRRALSVLLQSSLATRSDERILVLAPIRSFVLLYHPSGPEALAPMYEHFFGQAAVAHDVLHAGWTSNPELITSIAPEMENLDAVVRYALNHGVAEPAVRAVVHLCTVHRKTQLRPGPDLLSLALAVAHRERLEQLEADLIRAWAKFARERTVPGNPLALFRTSRDIYRRIGDSRGVLASSVDLLRGLRPEEAIVEGRKLYQLAEQQQDHLRMEKCSFEIGFALRMAGRQTEAIQEFERAIGQSEHFPSAKRSMRMIAAYKFQVAECLRGTSDTMAAISAYKDALSGYQAMHLALGVQNVHMQLADTFFAMGNPREAIHHASCALAVERVEMSCDNICSLLTLAEAHELVGESSAATAAIERLRDFEPPDGFSAYQRSRILTTRGVLALHRGHMAEARELLWAGRTVARQQEHISPHQFMLAREAAALSYLSEVEYVSGNLDEAASHAICATLIFRSIGASDNAPFSLMPLAEVVDDSLSEKILEAIMLPFLRRGCGGALAYALLRSATIAQHRGQSELAKRRAQSALKRFGEIKDERRLPIARKILEP